MEHYKPEPHYQAQRVRVLHFALFLSPFLLSPVICFSLSLCAHLFCYGCEKVRVRARAHAPVHVFVTEIRFCDRNYEGKLLKPGNMKRLQMTCLC